jgi:ATP-dependent RNA helicase RhlE
MPSGFREFQLRKELMSALDAAGYDTPTPIQRKAIPVLLEGRDLIGVAETGTGKTLAFLLPIFQQMKLGDVDPGAIVVCPTRELAIQVAGEADRFGGPLGVRTVLAYGGTSSGDQKRALGAGVDLVVATPGRLLDFVGSAWLSLRRVRFLVLDEADRMLDMGFIADIDAILRRAPMSRQTMLFSATIPEQIRRLALRYMLQPVTVTMHRGTRVAEKVEHAFYPVKESRKEALLVEILRAVNPSKALVFTATREGTSALALVLRRQRWEVASLSSLLSQANRERALEAYRRGEFRILVATDVAARGLDITDIDLVINFDVPMHAEDYVHRIGRTGRAERAGRAVTLVTARDERRAADIEHLLGESVPRVRLEGFAPEAREAAEPRGGARSGESKRPRRGRQPTARRNRRTQRARRAGRAGD